MPLELPRLTGYLARLPDGVDSYPDVVVKAATFTACIADRPVPVDDGDVPLPLVELVRNPPPVSAWVPEVHMVSIFKMIGDHHFEGEGGVQAFLEWVYQQNRQLLAGRLYRVLFWLVQPESIFLGVQKRWGALRRGTGIEILERGHERCRVRLSFRPYLLDEEGLLAVGTALRAAADMAGAKQSSVEVVESRVSHGDFVVRWRL